MTSPPRPSDSSGLVKKLLFPSYADAGANDTFGSPSRQQEADDKEPADPKSSIVEPGSASRTEAVAIRKVPSTASSNGSVVSMGAPTEIRNNRSSKPARFLPPKQPSSDASRTPQRPPAPSFFATTRPALKTKPSTTASSTAAVTTPIADHDPIRIESPPKVPRRPMPTERASSTVVLTGQKSLMMSSSESSFPDDDSADESVTTTDEPLKSLVDSSDSTDKKESPVPARTKSLDDAIPPPQTPQWEEEANPEQTAFGKQLLFNRPEITDEDAMSTASEMGTVIGPSQLEDLDAEVEAAALAIENAAATTTPIAQNHSNGKDDVQYLDWDKEGLVLPVLEQREEEKKHADESHMSTANNMLTLAIRRLGSGLTNSNNSHRGGNAPRQSISAPSTPRHFPAAAVAAQPRPSSPLSTTATAPSSFLLRSPGSSAHFAAKSRKFFLSPRRRYDTGTVDRIPEDSTVDNDEKKKPSTTLPLHQMIARSCLSFDAYDTSIDQHVEYTVDPWTLPSGGEGYRLENPQLPYRQSQRNPMRMNGGGNIRTSASWDVSSSVANMEHRQQQQHLPLFRTSSRGGYVRRGSPERRLARSHSAAESRQFRGRIRSSGSDYSPKPNQNNAMPLSSPQRVNPNSTAAMMMAMTASPEQKQMEIEREDAIDILACLVERGVSFTTTLDDDVPTIEKRIQNQMMKSKEKAEDGDNDDAENVGDDEAFRKELVKSHQFALEMRRASQSASSWLKSIGRSPAESQPGQSTKESEGDDDTKAEDTMDLATTKAKLHAAEVQLQEKDDLSQRLNEELAQCRAEIGRLRSAASSVLPFRSPNRSILDQSDDVSVVEENEEGDIDAEKIDGEDLDNSLFPTTTPESPIRNPEDAEIARYKAALEEANERIRVLYEDLRTDSKDEMDEKVPLVEVVDPKVPSPKNPQSPSNQEEQTVNVRMLDAENFVTEWDDLTPPLAPPPEHGLRSPIVATILREWSDDDSLHESLITWIDSVLAGMDPASIPPLTISSLDHRVRDAFTTHVLPLLLRRPDIRVDVKTRAQRRTTYDLAVAVEGIVPSRTPVQLDHFRHLETTAARSEIGAGSAAHSSATTALMANTSVRTQRLSATLNGDTPGSANSPTEPREFPNSRLSYDEMSESLNPQQNSTLMSTLGGALGGLLARRKYSTGLVTTSPSGEAASEGTAPTQESDGFASATSSDEDMDGAETYHRVVSAPPGRIGVTFVEYRGHAMVSDVSATSPLQGWIFASDILIAIDELAVSGMRIREIIQILKDRDQSQRALRVISLHTMSDAVLTMSALNETTSEAVQ